MHVQLFGLIECDTECEDYETDNEEGRDQTDLYE